MLLSYYDLYLTKLKFKENNQAKILLHNFQST